jgi:hypothetical protein
LHRLGLRRSRPIPKAMNGAAFAHFSKTNIGQIRAALPFGLFETVPTIWLDFVVTK